MPEPVNNTATLQIRFEALEDLQGLDAAASAQITHNGFNQALLQLQDTGTTPVVDRVSYETYTIGGGGTVDIDLTALVSSQTNIDGTGKKVQGLIVINPAGNNVIAIGPGATNAYTPFGTSNEVDLYAQASRAGVLCIFQPEGLPDISGTVKNIRITGTATQTVKVGIWLG